MAEAVESTWEAVSKYIHLTWPLAVKINVVDTTRGQLLTHWDLQQQQQQVATKTGKYSTGFVELVRLSRNLQDDHVVNKTVTVEMPADCASIPFAKLSGLHQHGGNCVRNVSVELRLLGTLNTKFCLVFDYVSEVLAGAVDVAKLAPEPAKMDSSSAASNNNSKETFWHKIAKMTRQVGTSALRSIMDADEHEALTQTKSISQLKKLNGYAETAKKLDAEDTQHSTPANTARKRKNEETENPWTDLSLTKRFKPEENEDDDENVSVAATAMVF